ncbi:MAG TPA: hypothetical protein VJ276_16035 [Thermoanaerobaculia bacterium]|nr:hypothetical protein [Thermoanaerobaculia bacterium]
MDCVSTACDLAARLLAEGRSPWIGRLRDVRLFGDSTFHAPLIPRRFPHLAWTTHYVACADGLAYDPLAEAPLAVAEYAVSVFGRDIPVERFLSVEETERLLRAGGDIPQAFRHRIAGS